MSDGGSSSSASPAAYDFALQPVLGPYDKPGAASNGGGSSSSKAVVVVVDDRPRTTPLPLDAFPRAMRDLQARGKDPYGSDDDDDDAAAGGDGRGRGVGQGHGRGNVDVGRGTAARKMRLQKGGGLSRRPEREDFSRIEQREQAAAFLDSPELLMMYAQSKGDSLPAARLHFMKVLCGYDDVVGPRDGAAAAAGGGGTRKKVAGAMTATTAASGSGGRLDADKRRPNRADRGGGSGW